jgi:hypothetical protein
VRKVKGFFGARRRWPDSPRLQKLQVTWDIEAMSGLGNDSFGIYEHIQSLECDLMVGLSKMTIPMTEHIVGRLNGGFRVGEFWHFAVPNPRPHMHLAHRLQEMLNNGLQGKVMICLEDSYTHPHYVPYHEFDKLRLETPDADVCAPNW